MATPYALAMRLLASRGVVTILPGNKVRWNDDAAAPALQRLAGVVTLPLDWHSGDASRQPETEAY